MATVWVTHDLGVVAQLVERVVVMYAGPSSRRRRPATIFPRPQHPYTAALLGSLPGPGTVHRPPLRQIGRNAARSRAPGRRMPVPVPLRLR